MTEAINCVFCKIISGDEPGDILFEDEDVVVFKDIKPAAKYHYLAVPKNHIENINKLSTSEHKTLVDKLVECGKKVLEQNGGNVDDIRLGFHSPPFNSISHLHLHVISPASQMNFISRMIFRPHTWWFQSVDQLLGKLSNGNKL